MNSNGNWDVNIVSDVDPEKLIKGIKDYKEGARIMREWLNKERRIPVCNRNPAYLVMNKKTMCLLKRTNHPSFSFRTPSQGFFEDIQILINPYLEDGSVEILS